MAKKLRNIHPGEVLLEEFLNPMGISQNALARAIGVPPRDSALYLRARQWDGHQVWTSPLYFSGAEQGR